LHGGACLILFPAITGSGVTGASTNSGHAGAGKPAPWTNSGRVWLGLAEPGTPFVRQASTGTLRPWASWSELRWPEKKNRPQPCVARRGLFDFIPGDNEHRQAGAGRAGALDEFWARRLRRGPFTRQTGRAPFVRRASRPRASCSIPFILSKKRPFC